MEPRRERGTCSGRNSLTCFCPVWGWAGWIHPHRGPEGTGCASPSSFTLSIPLAHLSPGERAQTTGHRLKPWAVCDNGCCCCVRPYCGTAPQVGPRDGCTAPGTAQANSEHHHLTFRERPSCCSVTVTRSCSRR